MTRRRQAEATDRSLADELLLEGDEDAFRELYARHTGRLYQFVLRVLGGAQAEAEDVVQDTWIRAVERLRDFRWESQLSTWLIGIGMNLCRDQLRRSKRTVDVQAESTTATGVRSLEERIDLERAIALLPDGYREVLILHDLEGFTHGEIGQQLGIAEGTSKSQLFFARRTMRRLLAPAETNGRGQEHGALSGEAGNNG